MPLGIDLGAPVNTALLLANLYFAQGIIFPKVSPPSETPNDYNKSYSWMPKSHPPTVIFETFTPKTLAKFDGKDDGRVLLAINGTVFDVTAGKSFYGPGGPYGNFAGRDASRGMAKQSFEIDMLTPIDEPLDKIDDLSKSEIESMNGWIDFFTHKYLVCGKLVENTD